MGMRRLNNCIIDGRVISIEVHDAYFITPMSDIPFKQVGHNEERLVYVKKIFADGSIMGTELINYCPDYVGHSM